MRAQIAQIGPTTTVWFGSLFPVQRPLSAIVRERPFSDGSVGRRGWDREVGRTAHSRLDAAAKRGVFDPLVLQGDSRVEDRARDDQSTRGLKVRGKNTALRRSFNR